MTLQKPDTLLAGETFEGRFEILSTLGQGGVGVVYKARHMHMDKIVAIKTLRAEVVDDENSFRRFEQEARTASNLSHPNIISIFDFGKSPLGFAYLVMEYLPGQSLDDILKEQSSIDLDLFLRIFSQACDGLHYAHKKGVIHRDIKPSNIMLTDAEEATNVAKIVDFGLAKMLAKDIEQHLTQTGTLIGTPLYMSPEQCRGAELDHRTDIYSLGCVMYKALTGRVPLTGESAMQTIYKRVTEAAEPLSVSAPHLVLPPAIEQVVMKSLERDPNARQQSMADLRTDLTNAIFFGVRSEPPIVTVSLQTGSLSATNTAPASPPIPRLPPANQNTPVYSKDPDTSAPQNNVRLALAVACLAAAIASAGTFFWLKTKHDTEPTDKGAVAAPASAPTSPPTKPLLSDQQTRDKRNDSAVSSNQPVRQKSAPEQKKTKQAREKSTRIALTIPAKPKSERPKNELDLAKQYRQKAEQLDKAGAISEALQDYVECLNHEEKQEVATGKPDPLIFLTCAQIIHCSMHLNSDYRFYLNKGLAIFSGQGPALVPLVQKQPNPKVIWQLYANACKHTADKSVQKITYLGWSSRFFTLASEAAKHSGDTKEQSKIESERTEIDKKLHDAKRSAGTVTHRTPHPRHKSAPKSLTGIWSR